MMHLGTQPRWDVGRTAARSELNEARLKVVAEPDAFLVDI